MVLPWGMAASATGQGAPPCRRLEHAAECAISAKFATSGQDCLAANRILVERPVYDEFCERFARKTAALDVGQGIDNATIRRPYQPVTDR